MTTDPHESDCIAEPTRLEDFPILRRRFEGQRLVHLDSAATSLTPVQVVAEMSRYYLEIGANIHRGDHYLSEEASVEFEQGRHRIAQYLGVTGNQVVFVRNTTEALNLVAGGLELGPGDLVAVSGDAHHSSLLPWLGRATTELVRVERDGTVDLDHYAELLRRRPRVVALSHCSNVTGLYIPLEAMARAAREAGALVVVDAAQSMPHRRIDLASSAVDFLAFSAHKMLGPTGIGVLVGRQEHLERLTPRCLGGGAVDWVDRTSYRLRKIPHRLEPGTPHIAGVFGLVAAIRYLEKLGLDRVAAHDRQLGERMHRAAAERDYLEVVGPGTGSHERAAILSVKVRGQRQLGHVARMLSDSYGVMCRTGHLCAQPLVDQLAGGEVLRASAYVYNTAGDVDDLFRALDEIQSLHGGA